MIKHLKTQNSNSSRKFLTFIFNNKKKKPKFSLIKLSSNSTPLTKGQIDRLRRICSTLFNAYRFPRIAYRHFVPYKSKGDVCILEPLVQQLKLHWCWLADLLIAPAVLRQSEHNSRSFLHTSVPYLKYGLSLIASSYLWPLLFSTKRRGFHPLTTSSFTILFSLMYSLPTCNISQSDLSLATFLQLDLVASVIIPSSHTPVISASESIISAVFPRNNRTSMSKILVRDFFIVDPRVHIYFENDLIVKLDFLRYFVHFV